MLSLFFRAILARLERLQKVHQNVPEPVHKRNKLEMHTSVVGCILKCPPITLTGSNREADSAAFSPKRNRNECVP